MKITLYYLYSQDVWGCHFLEGGGGIYFYIWLKERQQLKLFNLGQFNISGVFWMI